MLLQAYSYVRRINTSGAAALIALCLALGSWTPESCATLAEEVMDQGITVDLREPTYSEGVLQTEQGGVITAPGIRIQGMKMCYTKQADEEHAVCKLEAEGDLILEFGQYIFVGNRLEYDFLTRTGIIYQGRTAVEPWFVGGDRILLCRDGSYVLYDGYITTSEHSEPEWRIATEKARLTQCNDFAAENLQFRFGKLPVFWLPCIRTNLDYIFDSPIHYIFRWSGRRGPRIGMIYEVFSTDLWKTFLHLDYRLKRGPGGGFEATYRSRDHTEYFHTINYYADDNSVQQPHERHRYRFQGIYHNEFFEEKTKLHFTYDKLSDRDMATDYGDKGLVLETAKKTQLHIRHQECAWLTNFYTSYRINGFQTVKQQLPALEARLKPYEIAKTGVIGETFASAAYLDFEYANNNRNVRDYNAPRCEFTHRFYRPFTPGWFNVTPEAGVTAVYYGNSPAHNAKCALLGLFGGELNTHLHRFYGSFKHVLIPYAKYNYYTFPTTNPDDHYIFDIEDGLYRLNMFTFGMNQNLYYKKANGCITRLFQMELFAHGFFDTHTIPKTIPKAYLSLQWYPFSSFRQTFDTAWDFNQGLLDHINIRTEWTVSEDLAIAAEYRHRSPFDWRKVDHTNFILDSFRSIDSLRATALSDRRDTFLLHFFWRFHPYWALHYASRQGWNRERQPNYLEYEINLLGTLRAAWHVKLAYRHREEDDRFTVSFSMGISPPDKRKWECYRPCLAF